MSLAVECQGGPDPKRLEMLYDPVLGTLRRILEGIEIGRGEAVGEPGSRWDQHAIEVGDRDAARLQMPLHLEDERGLTEA